MAENNELREMIEQNIVPNGTKGITGQGLKNTLLEMADAIGKGSSSAGGAGVVFYVGYINLDTLEATQTPEQKAHNAQMFQVVANSPTGVGISINLNGLYEAEFGISEGFSYVATLPSVMYVSEEVALKMGAPSAMIEAFSHEYKAAIFADGTVEFEFEFELELAGA